MKSKFQQISNKIYADGKVQSTPHCGTAEAAEKLILASVVA